MTPTTSSGPTSAPGHESLRPSEQLVIQGKQADTQHGELYRAQIKGSLTAGVLKVVRASRLRSAVELDRLRHDLRKQRQLRLAWQSLNRPAEGLSEAHEGLGYAHLNLPTEMGESEGDVWLFRSWVDGQPLDAFLAQHGRRTAAEAAAWGMQLAAALDVLHRVGLVHREVKPSHVIITEAGSAVLVDAGIGMRSSLHEKAPAPWTAPEVLQGQAPSFRSDLYSLGWLMWRAVAETHETLDAERPTASADIPPDLRKLLHACLSVDPAKRPLSAYQVFHWLNPFGRTARGNGEAPRWSTRPLSPTLPPAVPSLSAPSLSPALRLAEPLPVRPSLVAAAAAAAPAVATAPALAAPTRTSAAEARSSRPSWRFSARDPAFRSTVVLAAATAAVVSVVLAALGAALWWLTRPH